RSGGSAGERRGHYRAFGDPSRAGAGPGQRILPARLSSPEYGGRSLRHGAARPRPGSRAYASPSGPRRGADPGAQDSRPPADRARLPRGGPRRRIHRADHRGDRSRQHESAGEGDQPNIDRKGQHMKCPLIAIVCSVVWVTCAPAQDFPSRPITMIVPLPTGSAFDVTARGLPARMQASLGQPVIVENVTGAAGSVGTGRVARAAPDGYTIAFGGLITHVINGAVLKLPYDVLADFEPVSPIATTDLMVVARKDMPADDLKGLIAWLEANPDRATQGSGGPGSLTHLAGVFFQKRTGTRFAIVPYRVAVAAITDLVAGHLDIMFDLASNSLPHMRGGAIKAYAVMAKTRLRMAPDVPTLDE